MFSDGIIAMVTVDRGFTENHTPFKSSKGSLMVLAFDQDLLIFVSFVNRRCFEIEELLMITTDDH